MIMEKNKKRLYTSPDFEVEVFDIDNIISTSTQDDKEGTIDAVIEEPDAIVQDAETGEFKAYLDEYGESYTPDDYNEIY